VKGQVVRCAGCHLCTPTQDTYTGILNKDFVIVCIHWFNQSLVQIK